MDARRIVAVIVIAVVSACALPAAAPAQAGSCTQETKRLNTFKRGMKAAKRKYFRTHRSAKARRKFVRLQNQKLARLQRARRRCLAQPKPAPPQPSPSPTPTPSPEPRFVAEDVVSDAALASPAEISQDAGVDVIRTQLVLDLRGGATPAAVAALLQRLDAEVVSSLKGVGQLTVRIPDPGSLAALDALVASLAGDPALDRADRAEVPVPDDLPESILPDDSDVVRPQLAVRAHAAWNARAALGPARPALVVGDHFGAGPPGAEVAATTTAADFATGNPHFHGYMVLGLAAGAFDPLGLPNNAADRTTGLWAGPPLTLRAVDARQTVAGSTLEDRLVNMIRSMTGNVVLTTSLAAPCAATTGCSLAEATAGALMWIEKVRAFDLEARVLHTTSAGNLRSFLPLDTAARFNSEYSSAALLPVSEPNLRNTLVVENAIASSAVDAVRPLCLRDSSKRGGHIAAIGSDITSLTGPGLGLFLDDGGTSAATPQVAGAAATVWALNPSLSPSQVIARLLATARPATGTDGDARCAPVLHAPALDAYGAVLAADDVNDAPAREAVLDAVDATGQEVIPTNGRFDEKDLVVFFERFEAANGALDYGRFDLNGDGRTGGDSEDRVDLDVSSPPAWDFSARRSMVGLPVGYVETELTDLEVLCYEAAGPLYRGDTTVRDQFLAERCLPPVTIDVQFPAFVVPGVTHPLRITTSLSGVSAPDDVLPGVHLDLTVTGGTVGSFVGTTGQDGLFATTGRMFDGQSSMRVDIVARAGDGGPELARRSVHVLPQTEADMLGLWAGFAGCDGVDPVPFHLRITAGFNEGDPPLVVSITQAGSNTGVISQEIWGVTRQGDGTYVGAPALEEHTAVLQLQRVTGERALSGQVTGAWGRCPAYDFVAFFVSN